GISARATTARTSSMSALSADRKATAGTCSFICPPDGFACAQHRRADGLFAGELVGVVDKGALRPPGALLFRIRGKGCIPEGQLHPGVGTHARVVHVKDWSNGSTRGDYQGCTPVIPHR